MRNEIEIFMNIFISFSSFAVANCVQNRTFFRIPNYNIELLGLLLIKIACKLSSKLVLHSIVPNVEQRNFVPHFS